MAALTYTPIDTIPTIHQTVVSGFASFKTLPLEFRKRQLRQLYWAIKDHEPELFDAFAADLGKHHNEAFMAEINWVYKDIMYQLDHMDELAKPQSEPVQFIYRVMKPRVLKQPLGAVLVIGAFNFPVQLSLSPFIGAVAAGCTAVVKPSELTPRVSALLEKIVGRMDGECYRVVNGAVPETTKLLELRWDKICYTGNGMVARIVAAAAAKYLTPTLLELGGLNPVFITSKADMKLAAKRTLWSKVHNCGQICLAADYVLVDPSVEAAFVEGCSTAIKSLLPDGLNDTSYGKIVNERHFNRLRNYLETTTGKILLGGGYDKEKLKIELTLVKVDNLDDILLKEEIFGPILPFYVTKGGGLQEMLDIYNKVSDTPLGVYIFSDDKKEQEFLLTRTRSGGASINDTMFHGSLQDMPFGGVGESGTGRYRAKYSFDAFSHLRSTITHPGWTEGQMRIRYTPYTPAQFKGFLRNSAAREPDFDRDGNVIRFGFFRRLLMLGALSTKGGLVRYIVVLLGAYFLKKFWT